MIANILTDTTTTPTSTTGGTSTSGGTSGGGTAQLTQIFTQPAFWIVIGAIVLLIVIVYLVKRIVVAGPNEAKIIIRGGQVYKILDKDNPKYFMKPFVDRQGSVILLNSQSFRSDKLFINDGPDKLYKITYVFDYKVQNVKTFASYVSKFNAVVEDKINDELRNISDEKGADLILKNFKTNKEEIIASLNKFFNDNGLVIEDFVIKAIEPIGGSAKASK